MKDMVRKGLIATLLSPLVAVPAWAGPEYKSANGGTFTYYGQFSPAYINFDDGGHSSSNLADNSKSNTRFGFWLRQPFGENEFAFQFETALGFRQTSDMSQYYDPDVWSWDKKDLRRVDFSFKTAHYGTFYLGQGSLASDGTGSNDLSGTNIVSDVALSDFVGSRYLRDKSGVLSNVSMGDAFNNYDGTRYGRIRYDSPSYQNFTIGVSYGKNILDTSDKSKYYDVAVNYQNTFDNGMQVSGGVAYLVTNTDTGPTLKDTFGSVSVLWKQGWNVTATAGHRDPDGTFYVGKFGYIAKSWLPYGDTALSMDYYHSKDMASSGDKAHSYGLAVVQSFDKYNIQAYLGYRNYSYDDRISSYKDAHTYVVGMQWTF